MSLYPQDRGVTKTKDPATVNQVNPTQSTFTGCTYCHPTNHVFEKCFVYLAHQLLLEHMNAAFAKPNNNPYSQMYNPCRRNHSNFSWGQNTNDRPRPNFSNNFQPSHYQQNIHNQVSPPFFQNSQMDTRFSNMKRKMDTYNKTQEILISSHD